MLLSLVTKIMKHIIHNALMSHVLVHDFLPARQSGFKLSSFIQDEVLSATRDWHEILERKCSFVSVFIDRCKIFDSLPHSLILKSVGRVGASGVRIMVWGTSFKLSTESCYG